MSAPQFEERIFNLPYADRQLVVVLPDEVVAAAERAEIEAASSGNDIDWTAVGKTALRILSGSVVFTFVDVLQAWAKARQNGLNILQVSRTEACALLFPPGHPRDGVLYAGHPTVPSVYYTIASFHRMAFEHKFAEAINLLMHLGVTELTVEHIRGWSREFAGSLSVPLPPEKGFDARADRKERNNHSLLYTASLAGSKNPELPDGLVWYLHEPTWQSIAKGRTSFGLTEFSLSVDYEDDFGINAGLKVSARKAGLELGGHFEDHEATTWNIKGKFSTD